MNGPQGVNRARIAFWENIQAIKGVGGFFIFMGISALALLNCQPHFTLARKIATEISYVPFLNWIYQLPWIGGWIALAVVNGVGILGVILWGITQYFQILPLLVKLPSDRLKSYRGIAYGYEVLMCFLQFPPYKGGVSAFLDDFWRWDLELIDWWHFVLFLVAIFFFEMIAMAAIEVNKSISQ
jgi:hypothetical protein